MKKKIVFMLQNGIGFGHFKLALTISKYLENECEISFITQAKSTLIFDNYNYKIYNFPMLYALKSNNEVLILNRLMNSLIEQISPDLVIEDTYPEDFYLNLPSLKNVSKVLIMNRLTASEFEEYYFRGVINQYDRLIVLKNKKCFTEEISSKEVINYVNYTDKISYLCGVFNETSKEIEESVKNKYNIESYEKTVVVNCGAGGWHIGSNICEKIFKKVVFETKELIKTGINLQTILILGPYSKYLENQFKNDIDDHIKIVDFETNLDALFHVVDLVILRPGYNSTMEAISGGSNILLLPGISYMENQESWCKELAEIYGIDYLNVNNLDEIHKKIKFLLVNNIRTTTKPINNTEKVAEEILKEVNFSPTDTSISLLINNLNNYDFDLKYQKLRNIEFIKKKGNLFMVKNIPILNMSSLNPTKFNQYDAFIIYNDNNLEYNRTSYYESRYHLRHNGYTLLEYEEIVYRTTTQLLKEITAIIKNPQKFKKNIVIKIPTTSSKETCDNIIEALNDYIEQNKIEILNINTSLTNAVNDDISNLKYEYYRPEISKLN